MTTSAEGTFGGHLPGGDLADCGNWNLAARLERTAARLPAKAALWADSGDVSFRELNERSSAVAGGLSELGVDRGDRVALMGGSHIELMATIYGVWKLGAILVAVNNQLGPAEVRQHLANAEPVVVVVDTGPRPRDRRAGSDRPLPSASGRHHGRGRWTAAAGRAARTAR